MTDLQQFLKQKLGDFRWVALTRKVKAEREKKRSLYEITGGSYVPSHSEVTDKEIGDFIKAILTGSNEKDANGNYLNAYEDAIAVHQLIEQYEDACFRVSNNFSPESAGTVAKKLALDFISKCPMVFYRNMYYVYRYGLTDSRNGLPMYGQYEPICDDTLRIVITKMYYQLLMTTTACNLCNQIAKEVKAFAFIPMEDIYYNRNFIVFRDHVKLNLTDGTSFYVTSKDFFTRTICLRYQDVLNNQGTSFAFDQICQMQMPDDYIWKQLLLEMIGAVIYGDAGKSVFIWQGMPGSFKSLLIQLIQSFWGDDPCAKVSLRPAQMSNNRFEFDNYEFARLLTLDDAEQKKLSNTFISFAKKVSGGDDIAAEEKKGRRYQEKISAPIFIVTNHKIMFDDDKAFEDRLVTLPFPKMVREEIGAPLRDQLFMEAPVVFRMAMQAHQKRILERRPIQSPWSLNYVYASQKVDVYLEKVVRKCCYYRRGENMSVRQVYEQCDLIFLGNKWPKNWSNFDGFAHAFRCAMENVFGITYDDVHRRMTKDGKRESYYKDFFWDSAGLQWQQNL